MTVSELLPCPFCGGAPKLDDCRTIWAVRCECGACVLGERSPEPDGTEPHAHWKRIRQTAITAWNRRTPARELDAEKGGEAITSADWMRAEAERVISSTPPAQAVEAVLDTARLNWLASLPMAVEFDYDQPGPGVLISFSAPAGTRASLNLRATCDAAIAAMQAGE